MVAAQSPWRQELRELTALATPVVLVQVGQLLMGTVDTMMLGRVSKEALAAGALGNVLSFVFIAPCFGLLMAVDPLVSQAFGARDAGRVLRHLVRGAVVALVLSVLSVVGVLVLRWQLWQLGQTPEIVPLAQQYLLGILPGIFGLLLFFVLRQTLQAMRIVRPTILAVVVGNVVNVIANYALVFGGFGAPALGVLGSALATSISRWVLFLIIAALAWPGVLADLVRRAGHHWAAGASRLVSYRDLGRIGGPIALHHTAEFGVFGLIGLLMGSLGAKEYAGHQVSLNLAGLLFMVPLGISGAVSARIGNAVGLGSEQAVLRVAVVGLSLGGVVMGIGAMVFWQFPTWLGRLYTGDAEVIAVAATLLPIAAVFAVADGLQVVASGVLRGVADTRLPAVLALFGFWVFGLPAGWWLCFRAGAGPAGLWWGLTTGLVVTALLLLARVRWRLRQPIATWIAEREENA